MYNRREVSTDFSAISSSFPVILSFLKGAVGYDPEAFHSERYAFYSLLPVQHGNRLLSSSLNFPDRVPRHYHRVPLSCGAVQKGGAERLFPGFYRQAYRSGEHWLLPVHQLQDLSLCHQPYGLFRRPGYPGGSKPHGGKQLYLESSVLHLLSGSAQHHQRHQHQHAGDLF